MKLDGSLEINKKININYTNNEFHYIVEFLNLIMAMSQCINFILQNISFNENPKKTKKTKNQLQPTQS
jgi:hypothetical protein